MIGKVNCSVEVKVKELGSNLILGCHRELEVFEVKKFALSSRIEMKWSEWLPVH